MLLLWSTLVVDAAVCAVESVDVAGGDRCCPIAAVFVVVLAVVVVEVWGGCRCTASSTCADVVDMGCGGGGTKNGGGYDPGCTPSAPIVTAGRGIRMLLLLLVLALLL